MLVKELDEKHVCSAFYEKDELIGMYDLFLYEDMAYLSYICVKEELQDRGYGSFILKKIFEEYKGRRIVADIEEVKEEDANCEKERKRREFYLRNGFVSTGIFYHIYGVDYELLSKGGAVRKDEWHALIKKHWGRWADTTVYKESL